MRTEEALKLAFKDPETGRQIVSKQFSARFAAEAGPTFVFEVEPGRWAAMGRLGEIEYFDSEEEAMGTDASKDLRMYLEARAGIPVPLPEKAKARMMAALQAQAAGEEWAFREPIEDFAEELGKVMQQAEKENEKRHQQSVEAPELKQYSAAEAQQVAASWLEQHGVQVGKRSGQWTLCRTDASKSWSERFKVNGDYIVFLSHREDPQLPEPWRPSKFQSASAGSYTARISDLEKSLGIEWQRTKSSSDAFSDSEKVKTLSDARELTQKLLESAALHQNSEAYYILKKPGSYADALAKTADELGIGRVSEAWRSWPGAAVVPAYAIGDDGTLELRGGQILLQDPKGELDKMMLAGSKLNGAFVPMSPALLTRATDGEKLPMATAIVITEGVASAIAAKAALDASPKGQGVLVVAALSKNNIQNVIDELKPYTNGPIIVAAEAGDNTNYTGARVSKIAENEEEISDVRDIFVKYGENETLEYLRSYVNEGEYIPGKQKEKSAEKPATIHGNYKEVEAE